MVPVISQSVRVVILFWLEPEAISSGETVVKGRMAVWKTGYFGSITRL